MKGYRLLAAPAALILGLTGVHAQTGDQGGAPPIGEWDYSQIYEAGGIRAENLLDANVISRDGMEIGEVENAVFDSRNRMVGIIAEVGGIWDIGDTHVAIPFQQLEFLDYGIQVPVTQENVDQFDLFGDDSFVQTGDVVAQGQGGQTQGDQNQGGQTQGDQAQAAGTWRVSDLIDDYAAFQGGPGYGYVEDVLISRDGKIQAVVVQSAAISQTGADLVALPLGTYADTWRPGRANYVIPYMPQEIDRLQPFSYERYSSVLNPSLTGGE